MSFDARLYLVAPHRIAAGLLVDFVPELAAAGVDAIQLREKDMEASAILEVGRPLAAVCRAAGIPFIVNDRIDVAYALGADGVHLGQDDLTVSVARSLLPGAIVGRSTHTLDQIDAETNGAPTPDYIAVGPVYETPTKPGRPAIGLGPIEQAATRVSIPWFAIGGIDSSNLPSVLEAGARRVVVVRAITEATHPPTAAAGLRAILYGAPL